MHNFVTFCSKFFLGNLKTAEVVAISAYQLYSTWESLKRKETHWGSTSSKRDHQRQGVNGERGKKVEATKMEKGRLCSSSSNVKKGTEAKSQRNRLKIMLM